MDSGDLARWAGTGPRTGGTAPGVPYGKLTFSVTANFKTSSTAKPFVMPVDSLPGVKKRC
eukprot:114746-Hanusia_phi.AAC.1